MKLLRKNTTPDLTGKVAAGIANSILKCQRWFAACLENRTKNWSIKHQWIFVYVICLVFGTMSFIAIIKPFRSAENSKIIILKSILIPKSIYKENKTFLITAKEFQQVQEYKKTHSDLLKDRPGLVDSLTLIEQIYYSQQK